MLLQGASGSHDVKRNSRNSKKKKERKASIQRKNLRKFITDVWVIIHVVLIHFKYKAASSCS